MDSAWQQVVALVFVAGAVWVLVRRAVRLFKTSGAGGCGTETCKSCPSGDLGAAPNELVQIAATRKLERPG